MKKGLFVSIFVLAAAAVGIGGYYRYGRHTEPPKVTTVEVSRGDVSDTVGATGTIEAVTTVQVGTQVSGTIKALNADFNSIVRRGQVVAELDPSLFETQVAQGRANLTRAQAEVERLRVALTDARSKLKRSRELSARNLIPPMELETAQTNVDAAEAQLRSAQAQVVQAQASLSQSEVNLRHCVIEAPIDGIVISRNVDVGQTVAASMQAPTLFMIAADLTKMRVVADVDESDVGRIRPGQAVRFRVDAYPNEEFGGTVTQIRLQPKVVQNVVTYSTVIDVPNPRLKLKPGMTATVSVEIARRTDVTRVPVAALRFRPSTDVFAALNQPVPPEMQRGGQRAGGEGAARAQGTGGGASAPASPAPAATPQQGAAAAAARPAGEPPASRPGDAGGERDRPQGDQQAAREGAGEGQAAPPAARGEGRSGGSGGGDPEQRRRRFEERMASMTPEECERFAERMRERGVGPEATGGGQGDRQPREGGGEGQGRRRGEQAPQGQGSQPVRPLAASSAQTIDSLFGPLPATETSGLVWLYVANQLKPVRVRLGISDGTYTELLAGELEPGAELVSSVVLAAQAAAGTPGRSPLMGPSRGPGGPPGGGGGGGRPAGR